MSPKWSERHITDSAQRILEQIRSRAGDRGLHVVDGASVLMMVLWSLLLWERKVGRVALEKMSVEPFDLARSVDGLLDEKAGDHPIAFDSSRQQVVLAKTRQRYLGWDFDTVLEPLLQAAEHEAMGLGHNYVGSEHLLLALVRLADSALLAVLQEHSVRYGRVREAVLELVGGQECPPNTR